MGWRVIIGFLIAISSFVSMLRAAEFKNVAGASEWVVRSWQTENGLPHNTINALLQTRDGFLWVGTSGGLARFDGVRFRKFGLQDGLRSVRISALAEDTQGALWAGTTGGGVSRWEKGRVTTFGAAEGFPSREDIVSMTAARDGKNSSRSCRATALRVHQTLVLRFAHSIGRCMFRHPPISASTAEGRASAAG